MHATTETKTFFRESHLVGLSQTAKLGKLPVPFKFPLSSFFSKSFNFMFKVILKIFFGEIFKFLRLDVFFAYNSINEFFKIFWYSILIKRKRFPLMKILQKKIGGYFV
eukprot:GHVP01057744.1.p1 GENE.GHVP01057744.1~~GHVP01057744.1.p1  ORF type:complete len:123 (-),score=15.37 GHVP01057744.1:257-580(-)